jgi:hypothetical protein
VLVHPFPARELLEQTGAGGQPVVAEEPDVVERLPRGAPVGDLRQGHAEKSAGVVGEPPQIVVLDARVGDQEGEVAGAVFPGDADGDGEGPDAAAELDDVLPDGEGPAARVGLLGHERSSLA